MRWLTFEDNRSQDDDDDDNRWKKEVGEFSEGKLHGQGKRFYDYGKIKEEGEFQKGRLSGQGKRVYVNRTRYEGEFEKGSLSKQGKKFEDDQQVEEEGQFENGQLNGQGKKLYADGTRCEGEFKNGRLSGYQAKYFDADGMIYEGEGKGKQGGKKSNIRSPLNLAWINNMPLHMQTMPTDQVSFENENEVNIFLKFQNLSPEEKKHQVEEISEKINSCMNEFQILDEECKRTILGQIFYYKIQKFGESNKDDLINVLKKTPEEANKIVTEFQQEIAKIRDFLIDKEIFSVEEIIEIVLDPKEFLERYVGNSDLITQN